VGRATADGFSGVTVVPVDGDRLDELVAVIARLATGELTARLEPSPARDAVDAVITGIDLLADELHVMRRTLEQQVTERTEQLDRARRAMALQALTDPLTGLANRALLGDRIGQANARAERGARPPCLVLLDLDGFKTINDRYGHSAGDAVLQALAARVNACVRSGDIAARFGGDELLILLNGVHELSDAVGIADKIRRAAAEPELCRLAQAVGAGRDDREGIHAGMMPPGSDTDRPATRPDAPGPTPTGR